MLSRFQPEIRALIQLVHPHVVQVLDVGMEAGTLFVVLQYLPGGSLRDRHTQRANGKAVPMPLVAGCWKWRALSTSFIPAGTSTLT